MDDDDQKQAGGNSDDVISAERLQAYLSQVLLRIFNLAPGLSSYVESERLRPDLNAVEISFYLMPEEVQGSIRKVCAVDKVEEFRYTKHKQPCVGFRIYPTAEDLSSLAVNDAQDGKETKEERVQGAPNSRAGAQANQLIKKPGQPSAT